MEELLNSMSRLCDGQSCVVCSQGITSAQEACFVTVPSKKLNKLAASTKHKFLVKWNYKKPNNAMHIACYERVLEEGSAAEKKLLDSVEETLERFCTYSQLVDIAKEVCTVLETSRSTVCFTGAGISTSAGISDYRGSAGIDILEAKASGKPSSNKGEEEEEEEDVDYKNLQPTFAHKAIVELQQMDKMQYVLTQNCDNLHQKAGLPSAYIADLHGNIFVEYCEKCFMQYTRDYCVDEYSTDCINEPWYKKCGSCGWNHYTGRTCNSKRCKGKLRDTIVNFEDDLHEFICGGMLRASSKARHADVCIALGTSLSVYPAAHLPLKAKKLIIVNLQTTELDSECDIRVFATCDDFFKVLMEVMKQKDVEKVNKKSAGKKRKAEETVTKEIIDLSDDK